MRSFKILWTPAVIFSVVVTGGCGREARQTVSARTEADGNVSVAPAAKAALQRETSLVRVLHAIPGGGTADVFAGDHLAFSSLEYRTLSPYQELPAEWTTFRLRPTGEDRAEPLAEEGGGLIAGRHYTIVALPGERGGPAALKVLPDELVPPPPGKAKVRVVNASPDAGNVAVFVGGRKTALVKGVAGEAASGYVDAEPIQGTVEVRSERNAVAHVPNSRIEPGGLYTVFLLGRTADRNGFQALLISDRIQQPAL